VMIPADAVKKIPAAVDRIARKERVIIDAARAEGFSIDRLKAAMGQSEDIH
jgi:hypothetical protein